MLYLIDEAPTSNFLYSILCSLFHFAPMDSDLPIIPDLPPMDPKPPDRHIPPMTSGPPPTHPQPPQTNTSSLSTIPPDADLLRSFEAMQLSSRVAQSSTHHLEEMVATQFNLLMKVVDPQGTTREITVHSIRLELQKVWKEGCAALNEVQRNLFLASFYDSNSMMYVWKKEPWIVRRQNVLLQMVDLRKQYNDYRF
jgi:hypothetical protein